MRKDKIYLPTLKRVKISNYSLYKKDIDYEIINGLNLIIGGNGVGKTTFISIIKYALIGLYKKDLDVRVYKGEKRLIRGKYANCNTFFRNRTKGEESDKFGCVELWFDIKDTSFYVKRGLYDVKIEEASYSISGIKYQIEGESLKQDSYKEYNNGVEQNKNNLQYNYEKIVAQTANLSDFEDFIFFVNQILLFGESRENVIWSKDVQERLLSNFLNDASLEKERKEYSLEAKYQDSLARHKQEEIKAIVRVLKQLDEKDSKTTNNVEKSILYLREEVERIEQNQQQLQNERIEHQKELALLYRNASDLSHSINEKEKEKVSVENTLQKEFWPGVNPKYLVYKRQFIGNRICPICNSNLGNVKFEEHTDRCFFCNSKIVIDPTSKNIILRINNDLESLIKERKKIEQRIISYEKELEKLDSDYRKNRIVLFNRRNEIRKLETTIEKNDTHEESSYLAMKNRIDVLTVEKEKALDVSAENRIQSERIMNRIEENLLEITKSISHIFADFAEAFMKLPCSLTLVNNNGMKSFLPVIDHQVRYEPEELSESQRFFVDYSFRMSILSYFYECPSFYICETPDSSLDISYEENAANIFMKYLEQPNSLILTTNLNNSTFVKSILKKAANKRVINLLRYGKISEVQKNHEILHILSKEIEEMCDE